jgi:hypothetical protein
LEDNVRKTCRDLISDAVVLGAGRPLVCLLVEAKSTIISEDETAYLIREIIDRTREFNQRLFGYERIDAKRIGILPMGSLPRTKVSNVDYMSEDEIEIGLPGERQCQVSKIVVRFQSS